MTRPRLRRPRLDLASLVAVPFGIGLVVVGQALEGGTLRSLLQPTAGFIVFGGTLGAVLLGFAVDDIRQAVRALPAILSAADPIDPLLTRIVRYAVRARREGILALQEDADAEQDPFLGKALSLAVDGTDPKVLRDMLAIEDGRRSEVDERPARVFDAAGGYAPTFGILGAVLGLIQVMENLTDPTKLGAGIAVAFVATVYGVGSANLVFLPVATKLRVRARDRALARELAAEGILAIQEGLNPWLIDEKLRGFIVTEEVRRRKPLADRRAA